MMISMALSRAKPMTVAKPLATRLMIFVVVTAATLALFWNWMLQATEAISWPIPPDVESVAPPAANPFPLIGFVIFGGPLALMLGLDVTMLVSRRKGSSRGHLLPQAGEGQAEEHN